MHVAQSVPADRIVEGYLVGRRMEQEPGMRRCTGGIETMQEKHGNGRGAPVIGCAGRVKVQT